MGNEASKGGGGATPNPGMMPGPQAMQAQPAEPSPGQRPQLKAPPRDPLYHSEKTNELQEISRLLAFAAAPRFRTTSPASARPSHIFLNIPSPRPLQ